MMRFFLFLLTTISFASLSATTTMSQDMQNRANNIGTAVGSVINRDGVIQTQQAMMGDGLISTLNGTTSFSSQASCGSDAHYLDINGTFSVSGLSVSITADTNLDGTMDSSHSVNNINGLCSNGYFKCANPSTATACEYYEWVGSPLGDVHRTTASGIDNLYNCRCIDASCDANSASVIDRHLETVGSGMVQSYQKQNPYFAVSDVKKVGTSLQFHGRVSTACSSIAPDPNLSTFYDNPASQAPAASAEQSTNHYFSVVSSSTAQVDSSVNASCSIIRNVSLKEVDQDDIIDYVGHNDAVVSSCGSGCMNVTLGSPINNHYVASDGCDYFTAFAEFNVLRPELITSVSFLGTKYDDKIHIDVNGNTILSEQGFLKTQPEPSSCELNTNHTYSGPPINMTSHFQTAGLKRINSTIAVGGWGNQLTQFRIRYKESDVTHIGVWGASQGRDNLTCNFDLVTGINTCTSDGVVTKSHMNNSIDYDTACASGTSKIHLTTTGNFNPDGIWPGAISGPNDTTINYSYVAPTCANFLKGSFSVTDMTNSSSIKEWLGRYLQFDIENKECLVTQSIINNCQSLSLNECSLKNHDIDGLPIISNYSPTGSVSSPITQTITDGSCSVALTEEFFIQNKTYSCPSAPPTYSVDTSHLVEPSIIGNDIRITTSNPNSSDPSMASSFNMPIPEMPQDKPCAFECRVKRTTARNSVNTAGNETNERSTDLTTEIFTRPCEQNVCPIEGSEVVIEPCGCINDFAQVAASLEVMKLAGKDISCVIP